jgi:hypothetical protein
VARNKGDKDYTKSEKQLLISLINDYSLFGATDSEVIQILSTKINNKISETRFYRLKKEAAKKRGESEQWLDSFVKYQYVEFYRKRVEELEFVQRTLVKMLVEEKEKEQKNKSLINQLSKTIADNSKALTYIGMAPPMLNKISSLVTIKYTYEKKGANDDLERITHLTKENVESAFCLQLDYEDIQRNGTSEFEYTQRVF